LAPSELSGRFLGSIQLGNVHILTRLWCFLWYLGGSSRLRLGGVGNFFVGCIEEHPGLVCLLPAGFFFDQLVSCGEIRTNPSSVW